MSDQCSERAPSHVGSVFGALRNRFGTGCEGTSMVESVPSERESAVSLHGLWFRRFNHSSKPPSGLPSLDAESLPAAGRLGDGTSRAATCLPRASPSSAALSGIHAAARTCSTSTPATIETGGWRCPGGATLGAIGALMNRVLQPRPLVVLGLNVWMGTAAGALKPSPSGGEPRGTLLDHFRVALRFGAFCFWQLTGRAGEMSGLLGVFHCV